MTAITDRTAINIDTFIEDGVRQWVVSTPDYVTRLQTPNHSTVTRLLVQVGDGMSLEDAIQEEST